MVTEVDPGPILGTQNFSVSVVFIYFSRAVDSSRLKTRCIIALLSEGGSDKTFCEENNYTTHQTTTTTTISAIIRTPTASDLVNKNITMGFLDKTFQKLKIEAEKVMDEHKKKKGGSSASVNSTSSSISMTMAEVMHYSSNVTRWEKAAVAIDSVVEQVTQFDPDGVEIVCVGGDRKNDKIEWHEGNTDTQGLEDTITQIDPGGPCPIGKAMDEVLTKALEKNLETTPCSVLVLTAGKPDDPEILEEALRKASQVVADHGGIQQCPLSVTFIQIGNDRDASEYLAYLDDKKMVNDIVDTMGYEELKETVESMRSHTSKAHKKMKQQEAQSAILGTVAGAAMGVGGMLLHNNNKTKKSILGGEWNCFYEDEQIATLTVKDDYKGNLFIDGLHEDIIQGVYHKDDNFCVRFTEPDGEVVEGNLHAGILHWSDGTRWKRTKPKYFGAASAGAALVGATVYAIHKKFFQNIKGMEACDYVLVLDRSAKMAMTDIKQ